MDVREKLVEIIQNSVGGCARHWAEVIADGLIAHGVTVQELDGCEYCRIAWYTEKPFTVITQMGREVKTQFNFCPTCGRKLIQPTKGE